jgi:hypothetical protein
MSRLMDANEFEWLLVRFVVVYVWLQLTTYILHVPSKPIPDVYRWSYPNLYG